MSWNYRVMRHNGEYPYYAIHEVYYNDKGKIWGWTQTPEDPLAEDIETLGHVLEDMLSDFNKSKHDVLDFDMEPEADFPDGEVE